MADTIETKGTETQKTEETKKQPETEEKGTEQKKETVDTEGIKTSAIANLLRSLGVESEESLQTIVSKHNEDEQAKLSELEKSNNALKKVEKELLEERGKRINAEAKLSALMLGANKDMVDDLVIVATAKTTKDKDINAVMQEIKDSPSGKAYFVSEEDVEKRGSTITRTRVTVNSNEDEEDKKDKKKDSGLSLAQRLHGSVSKKGKGGK